VYTGRLMAFDTSPMDIGGDVVYELLSARRIRAEIFESRRTWSLCRFSSCSSGVMVVRGGLEARDFVSLGGVMLGSDPLMIELKSVPRMLLLLVEPESRGPAVAVNIRGSEAIGVVQAMPTWPSERRPWSHSKRRVKWHGNGTAVGQSCDQR